MCDVVHLRIECLYVYTCTCVFVLSFYSVDFVQSTVQHIMATLKLLNFCWSGTRPLKQT